VQSCDSNHKTIQETTVIASVEQATQVIAQYNGKPTDFVLPIAQDENLTLRGEVVSRDVAMAIINDRILAKGWMPNGFEEKGQVRYYKYSQ
jgi:hypothetical protein